MHQGTFRGRMYNYCIHKGHEVHQTKLMLHSISFSPLLSNAAKHMDTCDDEHAGHR